MNCENRFSYSCQWHLRYIWHYTLDIKITWHTARCPADISTKGSITGNYQAGQREPLWCRHGTFKLENWPTCVNLPASQTSLQIMVVPTVTRVLTDNVTWFEDHTNKSPENHGFTGRKYECRDPDLNFWIPGSAIALTVSAGHQSLHRLYFRYINWVCKINLYLVFDKESVHYLDDFY